MNIELYKLLDLVEYESNKVQAIKYLIDQLEESKSVISIEKYVKRQAQVEKAHL